MLLAEGDPEILPVLLLLAERVSLGVAVGALLPDKVVEELQVGDRVRVGAREGVREGLPLPVPVRDSDGVREVVLDGPAVPDTVLLPLGDRDGLRDGLSDRNCDPCEWLEEGECVAGLDFIGLELSA